MRTRGFTLIELVTTVAIVAVLASLALPLSELAVQRSREQQLHRALRDIRDAIDAYKQAADDGRIPRKAGDSGYPKRLEDLASGIEDLSSPRRERIYFLRRVPRDPFTADPLLADAATWGRRSYASPPEAPKDGDDVFDVYSLAPGAGINGRPYREW